MDKKIAKSKWTKRNITYLSIGAIVLIFLTYYLFFSEQRSKIAIDPDKVTFAEAKSGDFQEYIIQTGEVVPSRIFFLDAVEGGNIVHVLKESGSEVRMGDPILELENANLRLSVLSQENSLIEQINRVRTTRLQLDQNYLAQKQQLAQIDNQLAILRPKFSRDSTLYAKKMISLQDFQQTEADFKYNAKRREFTYESFKRDSELRVFQLAQLKSSEASMMENLNGVRRILDNLIIKAPIDGQLSTIQLNEGKNVVKGERLGQVDIIGNNKISVKIDEIYLSRVTQDCRATTVISNETFELSVNYIYPTITDGQFEVDMTFTDGIPEGLINGQSLRMKIELGQLSKQIQIPVGGFYSNTGGNWVYVVNDATKTAEKRNIQLGRKNSKYYEVLDGLSSGDKVIVSSYDNFGESEILTW